MNRRDFLMTLGASLIPRVIRVNQPLIPTYRGAPILYGYNLTPSQIMFLSTPLSTSHQWFYGGARRGGKSIHNEIVNLIQTLEEDKWKPS